MTDYEKFEAKCMSIACEQEAEADVKRENEVMLQETTKKYFDLVSILCSRMMVVNGNKHDESKKDTSSIDMLTNAMQIDGVNNNVMQNNQHQQKQAELRIEQFSGSLNDWFKFKNDIKAKLVDNENISSENKMIEFIQVCPMALQNELNANGFEDAWHKLQIKYDEKYRLTQFFVRKMLNFNSIEVPSEASMASLLSEVNEIVEAQTHIQNLNFDDVLVYATVTKLDQESQRAWHRHRKALAASWAAAETDRKKYDHMPTLDDLKKFLKDEIDFYQSQMIDSNDFQNACSIGNAANAVSFTKAGGGTNTLQMAHAMSNANELLIQRNLGVTSSNSTLSPHLSTRTCIIGSYACKR